MTGKAPRITLYSTAGCAHCKRLRQWLQQRGVHFQEFDIQRNRRAFKAYSQLGARAVPVLMIGERRVDGFDPKLLDKLLP